jgi:putative transposase
MTLKALTAIALTIFLWVRVARLSRSPHGRRRKANPLDGKDTCLYQIPKPEWVRLKIIGLKALMPEAGCRKVADTFNRLHAHEDMTVGKTYVSSVIRKYRYEIKAQRRKVRNRRHKPTPTNRVWGLDLTFVADAGKRSHPVLGILDHGSRANLALLPLESKSALELLRLLHAAMTLYGRPKAIRTDNEGMFKSWLFRLVLLTWGVRHQLTDPHCPWQNGRIERFFGTLKQKLRDWSVEDKEQLRDALCLFRAWYNHVRPHQHLRRMTPAEAWAGADIHRGRPREMLWFDAWDGLLTGYLIRR